MFGIFSKAKKNTVQKLIEEDGIEHATQRFAEVVSDMLVTRELAYQFILEEVEAASQGNEVAIRFASESGITASEYKGAMQNSRPEIDGVDGPQQFLTNISNHLNSDIDLMVKFRTKTGDKVMQLFQLGKYFNNDLESKIISSRKEGMRLEDAEVDIMFIVKNDQVKYINGELDHLFTLDKDGDKKLDGRVVNMVFTGLSDNNIIEIFVVFDDSDSYTMFTLGVGRDERLNYVAQAIGEFNSQVQHLS